MKPPKPYRKARSLERTAAQIDKARELRRTPTETERAARKVVSFVLLTEAVG